MPSSGPEAASGKRALRAHLKRCRAELAVEDRLAADAAIARGVEALAFWESAHVVYTYLSFGSEVDTRALCEAAWAAHKVVALPRVVVGTRRMRWFQVSNLDGLERSPLGVEEPYPCAERELDPVGSTAALALVPGLTFDAAGHRLGYGGGFYDTFLAGFLGISVGLCRVSQLCEAVPFLETHDRAVDVVVTDRGALGSLSLSPSRA